jgi:hypothetical protein
MGLAAVIACLAAIVPVVSRTDAVSLITVPQAR